MEWILYLYVGGLYFKASESDLINIAIGKNCHLMHGQKV